MGCGRQSTGVADAMPEESREGQPQQISWEVRFAIEENGQRRAHLLADRMEHYETEDSSYVLFTMIPDSTAEDSTVSDAEVEIEETADTMGANDVGGSNPAEENDAREIDAQENDAQRPAWADTESETGSKRGESMTSKRIAPERAIAYIFEEGDSSAVIIAERMMYFADEGRFEAFGNVDVRTVGEKRLSTEHLTWKQSSRKIQTRRFVRITTPTEDVQGNGLVADEDLDTYQIGRFTANVDVDEEANEDSPAPADEGQP